MRIPISKRIKAALGFGPNDTAGNLAKQAQKWFHGKTTSAFIKNKRNNSIKRQKGKFKNKPVPGKMYFMTYSAKHKQTLPYWDRNPLFFVIGLSSKSMLGINLHYLPPALRIKLLVRLMDLAVNKNIPEKTKIRASYSLLKGAAKYRLIKPTVKRYLFSHIRSSLYEVPGNEWKYAIMLPLANWQKSSAQGVWADSRKMI